MTERPLIGGDWARAAPLPASELIGLLREARTRTLELISDLDDRQLEVPLLAIINPPLWEIGHVGWFHEKWVLRHAHRRPSLLPDADALYDSAAVHHDTRWSLSLPGRQETLDYVERVLEEIASVLEAREPGRDGTYLVLLGLYHEYMHAEALTYTRQTLSLPAPRAWSEQLPGDSGRAAGPRDSRTDDPLVVAGDVLVPGGRFDLGASEDAPFVFDNEKWSHPVELAPFLIARTAVTQSAFADFVDDGGYRRRDLWSPAGWEWREKEGAAHPLYWRREGTGWLRRVFDAWEPLAPQLPVIHVNAYECEAYCLWAGRRLPSEPEWEAAASAVPLADRSGLSGIKRRYPWGNEPFWMGRANVNGSARGPVRVDALGAGDSAAGCRQMIGNVWEWTSTDFHPYPGFEPDPYREYSEPWFGDHRVLRGGAWCTRFDLLRNTWRNFYQPHRRDVWAGFRTCALDT